MAGLVIAGVNSSAGKTTVSLALMAALRARGLKVAAFKVGPDFIDPGHHAVVTGQPSHNLDGWMLPRQENLAIFHARSAGADVALVEGVMGLYDGFDPRGEAGSTAQMAKLLGLPVLLVANARSMARSLAALVSGFVGFDPDLRFAGVVANQVGSERHCDILAQAMESLPAVKFMGGLLRNSDIAIGERHLGLVTAEEGGLGAEDIERLVAWVEEGLDINALLKAMAPIEPAASPAPPSLTTDPVPLAVARDQAFCFYYAENLRRLEAAGAKLLFFSPLSDGRLPRGARGLYLGGGYPELFAEALAANRTLAEDIKSQGQAGMPIYAECGGMMYLGRELCDLDGQTWPMVGLLDLRFSMLKRLRSLGYREVRFMRDTILGPAGAKARGHEFHYSEMTGESTSPGLAKDAYQAQKREGPAPNTRAYTQANTLASYVHLHLGSNPDLALNLVAACRGWSK